MNRTLFGFGIQIVQFLNGCFYSLKMVKIGQNGPVLEKSFENQTILSGFLTAKTSWSPKMLRY
jgi:hypothetical protein